MKFENLIYNKMKCIKYLVTSIILTREVGGALKAENDGILY